jgi:peptidoglycan/LPS O-acetylase OafA/YrhL
MNKRLVELDALRGIAALMVVGYHYTTRFQKLYGHPGGPPFAAPWGLHGVSLFFLISGFVIFMTLERTRDWRDFLVSRFARLYPAYWAAVLLTAAAVTLGALPHRGTTLPRVLVNLTMTQEWLHVPHVDGVYWTLTLELSFYAIMLALYALRLLGKIEWVAVLWMGAMLADYLLERRGALTLPPLVGTTLLLGNANLFMAGVMFHRLHRAQRPQAALALIAAALALQFVIYGPAIGLICAAFFALFALILRNARWLCAVLSARPLVYLGTISYSLYLLHQNIGYVILRALYARAVPPGVAVTVTFAAVLLLAAAVNALVETPARAAIRAAWRARRLRAEAAPA